MNELSESMTNTLAVLASVTRPEGGMRWTGIEGLNVHKSSIRALDARGLVIWNAYRARVKLTRHGWDEATG